MFTENLNEQLIDQVYFYWMFKKKHEIASKYSFKKKKSKK